MPVCEVEAIVDDQPHTQLHTVGADVQLFEASLMTQLEVVGIVVVAQRVFVGKEGFASILCSRNAELQAVAGDKLVTQVVTIGVAQVAVIVATAAVEGDAGCCHERMASVSEEGGTSGRTAGHGNEVDEEMTRVDIEGRQHLQLAKRAHRTIAVDIFQNSLDMLVGKERQASKVFARGTIDVEFRLSKVGKQFQNVISIGTVDVALDGEPLPDILPPVGLCTNGNGCYEKQHKHQTKDIKHEALAIKTMQR